MKRAFNDALALASPSGKISKRSLSRAQERIRQELFGSGLERPSASQPSKRNRLLQQAAELRELAARGMKPRAYLAKAQELEDKANTIKNPLAPGYSRETIARNIRKLRKIDYSEDRAHAIAFREARRWFDKYNQGASLPAYLKATKNPLKSLERQGKQLFSAFMQRSPARSQKMNVPALPKVALAVGSVSRLYYSSNRGGRAIEYRHDFATGSRPLLAVSHDGKQLVLLGGAYRFTHRGIVDKPR